MRARSAGKLVDLDEAYGLFEGKTRVVDLCAAPGSWSQVVRERAPRARVVAVDRQPMASIEGVEILRSDITTPATADEIFRALGGAAADLVVCDGAPELTGHRDLDEFVHGRLVAAALDICGRVLAPGGTFVAKIFTATDAPFLRSQLRLLFPTVEVVKPASSRERSLEAFVVCRGFDPASLDHPYLRDGDLGTTATTTSISS
ncbi:hypothetical protein CTAYLR_002696 [Chrysophaeum taylorii]|uniref:Ribosomal RNA methyltransferase FtsJ domain-containing protein n=1 Tax=Chrysophaeum taylorii TaxID=2483200 RepID=A0AAD7XN18_9STRA|nr:hypothetical protein CTAYLR_002696 [Chrysophaeum taylorii]